jgi:hypothetical protein
MSSTATSVPEPFEVELGLPDPSATALDSGFLLRKFGSQAPRSVRVPGIDRDIQVKVASERAEWEEAFRLAAASYRARGYEPPQSSAIRFTRHHALPDTAVFVAKHESRVVLTFSLVADNAVLGLPMESIYGDEIQELRDAGRRLAEVTSLADVGLNPREFLQAFVSLIRVMKQYHIRQGGDTWVITVNPRHRNFYTKKLGYVPLGPCRSYPCVQDAPAEAFMLDLDLMQANAPKMYRELFDSPLPDAVLEPTLMPRHLVQFFGSRSSQTEVQTVREIFSYEEIIGSLRRW